MTLLLLILIGLVGLVAHWFKRWVRGQTEANLVDYMLTHKRYTAASVLTVVGGVVGICATGDVDLSQQTAAIAFMAGYNIDSALNKSPEES